MYYIWFKRQYEINKDKTAVQTVLSGHYSLEASHATLKKVGLLVIAFLKYSIKNYSQLVNNGILKKGLNVKIEL